jgi:hypothetical protein
LDFKYVWEKGVPMEVMSQDLVITCVSSLPTTFNLACSPPFNINAERFQLAPTEEAVLRVDFDPGYKDDWESRKVPQKL